MKSLDRSEIDSIYFEQYWGPLRLNEVHDQGIATTIFDCGVNRGISIGAKYAQRVCNLNGGALVIDGHLGMRSIASLNAQNRKYFISHFVALMESGYDAIIHAHPSNEKYRRGWFARANRLLTLI